MHFEEIEVGKVINDYSFTQKLGEGAFGEVWLASKFGHQYAVKDLDFARLAGAKDHWIAVCDKKIKSPFLLDYEYFQNSKIRNLFAKSEYYPGGNLEKFIEKVQKDTVYDWNCIMKIFIEITLGLHTLHSNDITHGNIKPSNILFFTPDGDVLISDVGFCVPNACDQLLTERFGNIEYMPFDQPRTKKVDVFSLGVIFYRLCMSKMPFQSGPDLVNGVYEPFPAGKFNDEFCQLIYSMLLPNPIDRPSAEDILKNSMIQKLANRLECQSKKLIQFFCCDSSGSVLSDSSSPTPT